MGTSVFLLWEYIITTDQEVELFWKRRLSGASMIFLANRYFVIVNCCINLAGFLPLSDEVGISSLSRYDFA